MGVSKEYWLWGIGFRTWRFEAQYRSRPVDIHSEEQINFLYAVLDAFPAPILVVDDDVRVVAMNAAAAKLQPGLSSRALHMRGGEMLRCVHATLAPEGCGRAETCKKCVVRGAVKEAFAGRRIVRRKARMEWIGSGRTEEVYLLVTAAPFERPDGRFVLLILEDISEIIELKRILPMCANCKKIRNDQEYWDSVEEYLKKQLDLDFSHSICPDCREKLYPRKRAQKE